MPIRTNAMNRTARAVRASCASNLVRVAPSSLRIIVAVVSTPLDRSEPEARRMIQLPPGIGFEKQNLGADRWAYVCRHETMGTLGRIVTMPNPSSEGTLVSCGAMAENG